ncbi:hypothetical protein ZEAMMB73_Zm00001d024038 [Zea mays]|uniref:Uncharacterized protein n=1 Tax=Zea mays TaxID=4577 RepID=A0A1D6IXE2_MAIZE|nr:hypothetical protein ZEAMMB73_Zm00001d024038 [Zea mays]
MEDEHISVVFQVIANGVGLLDPGAESNYGVLALRAPLEKYGLDEEKACNELLSFSDYSGSPQLKFSKMDEDELILWLD